MKLFAKKTLAMLLALSMLMSVCVFATDTDTGTGSEGEGGVVTPPVETPVAVTGVKLNKTTMSLEVGGKETLTAEVEPSDAADKTYTWKSSNPEVATVSADGEVEAKKAGTAVITVTTTDGAKTADCTVTVKMNSSAKIIAVSAAESTVEVPYNAADADVAQKLKTVKVTLTFDQGVVETTASWAPAAGVTFDSTKTGTSYAFVPTISGYTVPEEVTLPQITVKIVKAGLASSTTANLGGTMVPMKVDEEDLYLPEYVSLALNNNKSVRFYIGGSDDDFGAWESSDYNDDKVGEYTFTAKWKGGNTNYELADLKLTVKVVDTDAKYSVTYKGRTLEDIAKNINNLVNGMYGEDAEIIEIYDIDTEDGGQLYIVDEDGNHEAVDTGEFEPEEFLSMFYYPSGNGEDFEFEYYAYPDGDDTEEDDADAYVHGYIKFTSSPFMLITLEMTTEDAYKLDAESFEEAFLNMDETYEYLDYIFINAPKKSYFKSQGAFFYDYDVNEEEGEYVTSSTTLYYDEDSVEDDDESCIDDVVYVPGTSMKAGTYEYQFKAYGEDEKGKDVNNKTGYLRVILTEVADVTIAAGKEQTVPVDYDLFEEFIDENIPTKYDDYEITYIEFVDAPATNSKGWLYADTTKIKNPDKVTFYIDDDEEGDYAFDDLYFKGGTSDGTVRASFNVYGRSSATAKSKKIMSNCSVDFATGTDAANNVMATTIKASQPEWFGKSVTLGSFKALGGNNNEYVIFTSLPVGGKLVYNWGKTGQKDVTLGTKYYLNYKAGEQLMANVTFVPNYFAGKEQKNITMSFKAYTAKGKASSGTINITVNHAAYSAQFTDVNNSLYADSVDFLLSQGITTGTSATTFSPNNNVKRAEFVTFLWRAAGSPVVTGVTNKFTDVKNSGEYQYAYQAILWAVQKGITTGRSATKFEPAAKVTHQELLTFLYRYDVNLLGHSNAQGSPNYVYDFNSVDTWAQTAVKWAVKKEIIGAGYLQPTAAGNRATVALWLHRMLTL